MRENQMKILTDKFPLLLTGTIKPGNNCSEERVQERLLEYEQSIEKYICNTRFNPVVFIENSGYEFDVYRFEQMAKGENKAFEFVRGTACEKKVVLHGKGYGDGLLIYEGLTKSILLKDVPFFYKMTGRIFLKNSDDMLKSCNKHRNEFISYDGMGWCITYFFKANKKDYLDVLGNIFLDCDDKSRRDLEICTWLRLQKSDLDVGSFDNYPDIDGKMGDSNILYTKSKMEHKVRTIMIKLGIFTMNSKMSSLFWKIYRIVTKRQPYVTRSDV